MWGAERLKFAVAASRDMEAPAEVVWGLLTEDAYKYASIYSGVAAVERLGDCVTADCCVVGSKHSAAATIGSKHSVAGGGVTPKVGSRWRIHRHLGTGQKYYGDWTVTRRDDGPAFPRSILFYTTNLAGDGVATATNTWTVEPMGGNKPGSPSGCRVTITLGVVPHQFFAVVGRLMCCCVFKKTGMKSTERDLEDIEIALKAARDEGAQR